MALAAFAVAAFALAAFAVAAFALAAFALARAPAGFSFLPSPLASTSPLFSAAVVFVDEPFA